MDYKKVLWSSFRDTDKIFHIDRFSLSLSAGQTNGDTKQIIIPTYGPRVRDIDNTLESFRVMIFFKPAGTASWLPASPFNGSAGLSPTGIGIGYFSGFSGDMFVSIFSLSSSGSVRSAEVVVMASPVKQADLTIYGMPFKYGTYGREIWSNTDSGKIKWSSFDKQAIVADSMAIVYDSNSTARRLATIPHGQTTRPMVRKSCYTITGIPGRFFANPVADYVRVWKDNTNIYVEYEPPEPQSNGERVVEVWWYYE